jgi:hypothetical protein
MELEEREQFEGELVPDFNRFSRLHSNKTTTW